MLPWAQIIGTGISAWSSYKANKDNVQGNKDAFDTALASVDPRDVTGGFGSFTTNPDGSFNIGLDEKYAKERDYFLDDAAINKGFLTDYQKGGPAGAANTLFEERVDPLRRNQARAEAQFDEQGNARGMLGASEMMFARGQNTAGYQQAESAVYNQSYTDVQDIIDRYRARISTGVNQAVNIEGLPQGYADIALTDAANKAGVAKVGLEALSGAQTQKAESLSKFGSNLGASVEAGKFKFGNNNRMLSSNTLMSGGSNSGRGGRTRRSKIN